MSDLKYILKIISSLGEVKQVDEGLTVFRIGNDEAGNPVKIRVYATQGEAKEKEFLLLRLGDIIKFPQLIGRWRNYLVFRYLEIEVGMGLNSNQDSNYSIGYFLGLINANQLNEVPEEDLEDEFSDWLVRLSNMCLIPPWIVEDAKSYYKRYKPKDLPICIDYWDAMVHNFGWIGGEFYLLDEKHLRPSYQGVGLVKPSFLLAEDEWGRVKEGYEKVSSMQSINDNIEFLRFYYLVAALYFYSLSSAAGRVSLGTNIRFLNYRERLVNIVTNGGLNTKLRNELHLFKAFPSDIPFLLKRRMLARESKSRNS